jgi:hypothetical protein
MLGEQRSKLQQEDFMTARESKKWTVNDAVEAIRGKFAQTGSPANIPTLKGDSFKAELTEEGVVVDNLRNQPFLPWSTFQEAVCTMIRNGGRARRGDAMGPKLGEPRLPMDSIEGHVAHVVYGKQRGESVFRRITPIADILIWAGVCKAAPNQLVLR